MFWKKSKLTKREKEIYEYIMQEYNKLCMAAKSEPLSDYDIAGMLAEAAVMGNILVILKEG